MANTQEQDLNNKQASAEDINASATQEAGLQSEQSEQNQQAEFSEEESAGADSAANEFQAEEKVAQNTVDKTAAELQEYKDKYIRLFAEFENFRRRSAKENFEVMANANAKLLGKLTDVLDNFNLAFDPKNKAGSAEDIEKGIRLIYNKFKDILSEEGLTEVDPVGEEFDPNLHEALMQQPSDTIADGQIIQVLQKGYKAKNKILKHAKVIVSTGKS